MRRVLAIVVALLGSVGTVAAAEVVRDCPECPELVRIPVGSFSMGTDADEEDREQLTDYFRGRSAPVRRVVVGAYALGRFEVTRGDFRRFVAATGHGAAGCFVWRDGEYRHDSALGWNDPGFAQTDDHPAVCVSWEDASAYVAWLTQRTGRRYRLPSEAEWEYAARAGAISARPWGNEAAQSCRHANGADRATVLAVPEAARWATVPCDDGASHTAPVGRYAANAFGLHDMLGNAAEWTADCATPDHHGAPADGRARTDGDCALRMVRGGAWDGGPAELRSAYRVGSPAVVRVYARGFRIARDD